MMKKVLGHRVRFRTLSSGTVKTEVRIDGKWVLLNTGSAPMEGFVLKFAVDAALKERGK